MTLSNIAANEIGRDLQSTVYRATAVLKQGSRTSLFRGLRVADLLPVVIKILNPDRYTAQELEHLRSEFKLAKTLDGLDTVVQAHALVLLDGSPALILEDFGGESLESLLGRPLEIGEFLHLAVAMTAALGDIHERYIVHRDIKPQNFIISTETGAIKITDFGISRLIRPGTSIPATSGVIEGTLAYISPEQTGRMNRAMDFRSDLYSLGATFYQMLTGQLICDAQDALEWVHCHIARPLVPAHEKVRDIPAMLSRIVNKLMAKLAEDRYQTAQGLRRDLERCREEWRRDGQITEFELARQDYSDRFQLSAKLYGRDRELGILLKAFDHVAQGTRAEVVLVSGYSGIGKSSLVHELYKPIVRTRGLFIAGKFDQYQRHVPHATLLQAFHGLIQQILSESEERLDDWRNRLQDCLGGSAGVMVQVMPELELIVGKQPAVAELGPAETQNRFILAFQSFIRVFATAEHPLVIFLDDMQWADSATLQMLETFLDQPDLKHLLFVLAYRDNETGPSHPFTALVERLSNAGRPPSQVSLQPLGLEDLNELVVDCMHRGADQCRPLTQLILDKTGGNPFFANEFLKALYRESLIRFDSVKREWSWDAKKIEIKDIAENVVDLMAKRLGSLPERTRRLLALASCVGSAFDLGTLASIADQSSELTETELDEALHEGLVVHLVQAHGAQRGTSLRFQHDRIQQAAYATIDPAAKPATHLSIGRLLRRSLTKAALDRRVFDVVNQFNLGRALILSPDGNVDSAERYEVAQLNILAGRKAKASTAYTAAEKYFATAAEFLGPEAWQERFELAFGLLRELAESQYLGGRLAQAEASFTFLLAKAPTELERADIHSLQIRLYQVAGDYLRAVEISIKSLADLDLVAPANDVEAEKAVGAAAAEAKRLLGGRPIGGLIDIPRMTDPRTQRLMALLEASGPPVYMMRPALFPWVTLTMLNYSLHSGNTEASCYAYGIYAILLAAVFDEVPAAQEFSQLAIALNEKLDDAKLKGCMLHLLGDHVNFWKNPIATDLPILERGFRACVEGGDLIYSNYIAFQSAWHLWEKGDPLDQVQEFTKKYLAFAQQSKHHANFLSIRFEQQFCRALQGQLPRVDRMSDQNFDEADALAQVSRANYGCGVIYYHVMRQILAYMTGRFADAQEATKLAEETLSSAFSMPIETTFWFFKALTAAAIAGPERLDTVREAQSKFARWARNCPANFAAKNEILLGEIARLEGREFAALQHYERGAQGAHQERFNQYEALSCELAERLLLEGGLVDASHAYGRKASGIYGRWGAIALSRRIDERLPKLAAAPRSDTETTASTTTATYAHQLDLISVVKASQHISSEIELPKLLHTLMGVVIQYAGADRGVLLLKDASPQGELEITAEASSDGRSSIRDSSQTAAQVARGELVPESVLAYAKRTGQKILLDDSWTHGQFAHDRYILNRRPRSLLCLPISRHGGLAGVLYLENSLVSGAFNSERLTILDLFASQIAISIENSKLFKASQDAVSARDEFLSIASHELKTPLTALKLQTQLAKRSIARNDAGAFAPEKITRLVDQTDRSIERLTRLVEDMLDISRIATGQFELKIERFELSDAIRDEVDRLHPLLEQCRCRVDLRIESKVEGNWDRHRIEQVVRNLLTNAAKYGPNGTITMTVGPIQGGVRIAVQDEGIGIAPIDQVRIFQRFERAISANEVSGMGLGLYISRRIVEMHGGTIEVESRLGQGAVFEMRMPLGARITS